MSVYRVAGEIFEMVLGSKLPRTHVNRETMSVITDIKDFYLHIAIMKQV